MGISWHPAVHALSASEVDYAAGVAVYTMDARDLYRISMQAIWANYTGVTVKLQATLQPEAATETWADITTPAMSITASGNIVSAEIGPYAQIRVHVTATLSGGADTIDVWLEESRITR